MKKLIIYLKDYQKDCILAPLFKMLEASFELIVPLAVAAIIDRGIAGGNRGYIYQMCGIMIALGIIGLICSLTAQFFSARAAAGFAAKLRNALFSHLQGLSFTEIDTIGTSTMITRMTSDINQSQTGVNMFLRLFLRSPFVVFGAMIMAFMIDPGEALYFVAVIVLLFLVVFGIMIWNIPMLRMVQKKLDDVLNTVRENLAGIRVIRAFGREEDEIRKYQGQNAALAAMQKKSGTISSLMNPLTYIIINLAIIGLIKKGAVLVSYGELTQGQVVALYNYMSQILVELIKLANLIITINKALASSKRIAEVFDKKSSMKDIDDEKWETMEKQEDSSISVAFHHVSLTYKDGREETLSDIHFEVNKGEIIGIIGGTGSGKSSLMHLIPRFYDATKGEILVNGIDVRNYPIELLREKIGIVMQKAVLFKGTIAQNLKWGKPDATEIEMEEAVEIAQGLDILKAKGSLSADIAEGGKNLSGGQKQRLSIARALVKHPEILILDDSASALDMSTDEKLRKAIRNLHDHPTVFIVSQRTASIQYADRILVLEDGKVAGAGTHKELLETCEIYREIYDSQYSGEVRA